MPHTARELEGIGVKTITKHGGRHMWTVPHLLGQPNFFDRDYLELSRGRESPFIHKSPVVTAATAAAEHNG